MSSKELIQRGFSLETMSWVHEPGTKLEEESNKGKSGSYTLSEDGDCLTVKPDGKRDFWRKTYYQPLLVKNDGP